MKNSFKIFSILAFKMFLFLGDDTRDFHWTKLWLIVPQKN